MCSLPVFVGLDYHDASVRVCVLDTDGRELANADRCNDWKAIAEFADRFGRPVRAAIESCCGAADLAEELVSCAGWSVDLAHPGYVQRMKQNPDKTDYQDAQLVADLERIGYLPRVWLAPQHIRELRQVVRYRLQLTEQRRATKLRVRALLREQRCRAPQGVNAWTKAWDHWLRHSAELSAEGRWVANQHLQELACLVTRIRQVEKRLERLTANDVEVQRLLVAGLDDDVVKRGAEAEATELPDNASAAPDSLGDGIASTSSFTAVYSPPHSGFPSAMLLRKRKKPARKSAVCESFFLHQFLKLLSSGNFWKCFCK